MKVYILLAVVSTAFAISWSGEPRLAPSALPAPVFGGDCDQKYECGPCKATIPMWWFNAQSGKCEQFIYGGCGGNQNRYETKQQCEMTCSAEKPISWPGEPRLALSALPAPVFGGKCDQKYESGPCMAMIPMWWFNAQSGKCEQFIYGGCGGNQNRYETKRQCEMTCSAEKPISWPGEPRLALSALPAPVFGGNCDQKYETGPCKAVIPMWWYNAQSGKCEQFIYGGCGGNQNRYETKRQCEMTCSAEKPISWPGEPRLALSALPAPVFGGDCDQKYESGPCKATIPMWWFNAQSGKCEQFIYAGCGGNQNRYETKQQCEMTCSAKKPISLPGEPLEALIAQPTTVDDVCRRPPHSGPCMASFPRFYYDAHTKQCRPFIYGGCDSNGNNFETMRQCMRVCAPPAPWWPEPMLP